MLILTMMMIAGPRRWSPRRVVASAEALAQEALDARVGSSAWRHPVHRRGPCVHGVRQGERPTERGMQSLVAVLKPKPKRGRGPDGDEAKQKVIPCSVCGRGDEMMQMFGEGSVARPEGSGLAALSNSWSSRRRSVSQRSSSCRSWTRSRA